VQVSGFDELAEEVRKGNYNIDATAIAERLNNLKLLLRKISFQPVQLALGPQVAKIAPKPQ